MRRRNARQLHRAARAWTGRLTSAGNARWRMGEVMGVLTESDGRQVFQAKQETVEATPERLAKLRKFQNDLREHLSSDGS